jgi:hypothetical protein
LKITGRQDDGDDVKRNKKVVKSDFYWKRRSNLSINIEKLGQIEKLNHLAQRNADTSAHKILLVQKKKTFCSHDGSLVVHCEKDIFIEIIFK